MSSEFVGLKGGGTNDTPRFVDVEHHLGLLGVATQEQIAVARGYYFSGVHFNASVANDTSLDLVIKTTSALLLMATTLGGVLSSGGDSTLDVFVNPTLTDDGTVVPLIQINQLSGLTPKTALTHTPALTAEGTRIFHLFIPGGSGGNSVGGSSSPFQRLIAAPDTTFLIRGKNLAGTAKDMSLNVNLIEVPI